MHAALKVGDTNLMLSDADWSPQSVALFTQAALQGAFILAKAQGGAPAAADAVSHLHRYIESLLPPTSNARSATR
jgi:TetR/AcrR family transcriptional repressor of nem operon